MPTTLLLAILFLCSSFTACLAGAKMEGGTRFKFVTPTSVTIGCDRIANTSRENATGTLQLRLWAIDRPYQGGGIQGEILASARFEGLNPGNVYTNPSRTLDVTLPPTKRAYTLCLTLMEFSGGDYVIADYRNFSGTTVLGPVDLFSLSGPWSWQSSTEGGTIELEVGKIAHTRPGGTGSLRLALWATKQPYQGGGIKGFMIGSVQKDALKAGYTYNNLKNTLKYIKPPAGSYYVNLVLTEFNGSEYVIVDSIAGTKLVKFP
jgi:hypothetical protein